MQTHSLDRAQPFDRFLDGHRLAVPSPYPNNRLETSLGGSSGSRVHGRGLAVSSPYPKPELMDIDMTVFAKPALVSHVEPTEPKPIPIHENVLKPSKPVSESDLRKAVPPIQSSITSTNMFAPTTSIMDTLEKGLPQNENNTDSKLNEMWEKVKKWSKSITAKWIGGILGLVLMILGIWYIMKRRR